MDSNTILAALVAVAFAVPVVAWKALFFYTRARKARKQ